MPAYLRPLTLLAFVGLLSGCPLFRGHRKAGERCARSTDCDTVQCICPDGGTGGCGEDPKVFGGAGTCK